MLPLKKIVFIYVDGSFNSVIEKASWAFLVVNDKDEVIFKNRGVLEGEINSMWQVGGEIKAVENAIQYCKENNLLGWFNYDYKGIEHWISDITRNTQKPLWKTKNKFTKEYREFMLSNKEFIYKMEWVKSHSNNKYNDMVDELAGQK